MGEGLDDFGADDVLIAIWHATLIGETAKYVKRVHGRVWAKKESAFRAFVPETSLANSRGRRVIRHAMLVTVEPRDDAGFGHPKGCRSGPDQGRNARRGEAVSARDDTDFQG